MLETLAMVAIFLTALIIFGAISDHRTNRGVCPETIRNVILPYELKQEDFDWFVWSMEMAGLDAERVINTCSCGFAQECYMHCNHELNDGKCVGHAWKPIKVNSPAQKPELVQYQTDPAKEKSKAELARVRMQREKARLTQEKIRKEIDRAHIQSNTISKQMEKLENVLLTSYDPAKDLYTLDNGRKISRLMYEDLAEHGRLEAVYAFGREEPILYLGSPLERKWTERLPAR